VALALAAGAYLFYSFFLVTQGGLREVQKHLEAMTSGDLTTHPQPWGSDEQAHLMVTLAQMQQSLRSIVSRVRGSSDQIVHASGEIASAAMDLSSRTEQTASNLEQSAASMEQISATIKHTADNAQEAASVAVSNSGVAQRSGEVIGQVVSTMQEIHASSSKISDIIGVIDGIAFQTNILALNAAVEAARAGEQGRGFAVVASEVRSLAQRSAQAAKEIKSLISASVERVDSGTRVVQGAGATMDELLGSARRMSDLLREISTAAKEESSGVTQLGAAVQDLDRMTQQNAALVEQTAAAASSLKDQATDLAAEVARFRLP
ncbi:MAG TPA: methyl-accepting chemotaxis protein, partial [Rhizobacter sp.]